MSNYFQPGLFLMTRDGRVIDNAVVIELLPKERLGDGEDLYQVETVGGQLVKMSGSDIRKKFHLKDQSGFTRQQFYPDFAEQRRSAILKNRTLLKKFPRPTAADHQASLDLEPGSDVMPASGPGGIPETPGE